MRRVAFLIVLSTAIFACHSKSDPGIAPGAMAPALLTPADASVSVASPDAGALRAFADGNNALGLDLYAIAGKASDERSNLALCPLSISMALSMAWAGARGDKAAHIKSVLHASESMDGTLAAETAMLASIQGPTQSVTLKVANRLFGAKSYSFEPAFLTLSRPTVVKERPAGG